MTENLGTFRTIQVKIIIFFSISFLILGIVLSYTAYSNSIRIKSLYTARNIEEQKILTNDLEGMTLLSKTLSEDYAQWDDPYNYLQGKSPKFAEENLTPDVLERFESDGIWLFQNNGTLAYKVTNQKNIAENVDFKNYFTPIQNLFRNNFSIHFYIKVNSGILSVYGSTVVTTEDVLHTGVSPGYLLVGKVINNNSLKPLVGDYRNVVTLLGMEQQKGFPKSYDPITGKLAYEVVYKDINGQQIGRVYANYFTSSIAALHSSDNTLLTMNMLSFLALLIALLLCIWKWVIKPASDIYRALETVDRDLLKKKAQQKSEFGKIAQLIDTFFDQEKNLEEEIDAKKKLLDKLATYNSEIEHTNSIMIGRELKMIEMKKKLADLELKLKQCE